MKLLLSFALLATTSLSFAQTYKVDSKVSTVKWYAFKEIGAGHDGKVAVKNGSITLKDGVISSGEIIVDMNTITADDIPADKEANGQLVGHLKSPDFFNVAKYPEAKIVIKKAEKTAKGQKVHGDLTFNGKTNPVTFDAVVNETKTDLTTKTELSVDRTKWDLKYNSKNYLKDLAANKIIKNDFKLEVNLKATK